MVARRENFQRVYDMRERVLPGWDDARTPRSDEVRRELLLRGARALGAAPARWVPDYYRLQEQAPRPGRAGQPGQSGALLAVEVTGWDEPALVHPDNLGLLEAAAAGNLRPTVTTLLSPFDPVVWDRERALELFGFDYRIECYTPAAKRTYGYFTLPILHRGRLVGRLDPKAHRAEGVFEVRAVHLEPGVKPDDELAAGLAGALRGCADWHRTPEVIVRGSDPPGLAARLQRELGG